jgi:WS/DGAT/MGAT family acyltransferase
MLHNAGEAALAAGAVARGLLGAAVAPTRVLEDLGQAAQAARGFARQLVAVRAESPLHAERSLSRRLSNFTMSMAEIDAVRGRLGATNNDVVLTVVCGALRRWHASRHHAVAELRALVPVNLRQADDTEAGNRIALLTVSLPVGEPDPLRRLRQIQERMGHVKTERSASVYPIAARVIVALPAIAAEQLVRQQTTRANFVCTNVPGPRQTQFLAGVPIEAIYAYAPLVGDHPLAIALVSYRDTMFVGIDVDSLAMDDLPHFRDALRQSYEEVINLGTHAEVASPRRRAGRVRAARAK